MSALGPKADVIEGYNYCRLMTHCGHSRAVPVAVVEQDFHVASVATQQRVAERAATTAQFMGGNDQVFRSVLVGVEPIQVFESWVAKSFDRPRNLTFKAAVTLSKSSLMNSI